ncbi:hypothetical protein NE237_009631 [Protea cynaroides]|uniref:Uncharacterized protein n=1 Tax=Protea cynaroides TaxID=273540 RepID=A0A9Q0KY65_9MAGN|nr:hypothetical protein NE237_009631 [Protea cynaroides]
MEGFLNLLSHQQVLRCLSLLLLISPESTFLTQKMDSKQDKTLEFDNPDKPESTNLLSIFQLISGRTKERIQTKILEVIWDFHVRVMTTVRIKRKGKRECQDEGSVVMRILDISRVLPKRLKNLAVENRDKEGSCRSVALEKDVPATYKNWKACNSSELQELVNYSRTLIEFLLPYSSKAIMSTNHTQFQHCWGGSVTKKICPSLLLLISPESTFLTQKMDNKQDKTLQN